MEALRETVSLVTQSALSSGISIKPEETTATPTADVSAVVDAATAAAAAEKAAEVKVAGTASPKTAEAAPSGTNTATAGSGGAAATTSAGAGASAAAPSIGGGVSKLMSPAGVEELQKSISARPEIQPLLLMTEARGAFSSKPPDLKRGAALLEEARDRLVKVVDDPNPMYQSLQPTGLLASICSQLSSAYESLERKSDALTASQDACKWCTLYAKESGGAQSPMMIGPLMSLSVAHQSLKQWDEAVTPLTKSIEIVKLNKLSTGEPWLALSAMYSAQSQLPKSIAAVEAGLAYLGELHPEVMKTVSETDVKSLKPDQFNVSGQDIKTVLITMKVALHQLQTESKTGISPQKMMAAAMSAAAEAAGATKIETAKSAAAAPRRECSHCHKLESESTATAASGAGGSHRGATELRYQRCSRCRSAYYCTPICQAEHWPKHKSECKLIAEATAEGSVMAPTADATASAGAAAGAKKKKKKSAAAAASKAADVD